MKLKHFLLTFLILTFTTLFSQTVDYYLMDELPKVRTEKIEPDGSIWYSYVKQDTFYLDSISPVGHITNKISFQVDITGTYVAYIYHHSRGVIITQRIDDPNTCDDCGKSLITLYNLNSVKIWETNWTGIYQYNFWGVTTPQIINDSLFLIGKTGSEDPMETFIINMDWQGNITNNNKLNFSCILNYEILNSSIYLINRTDCSGLNYQPRPAYMYTYDSEFNPLVQLRFKVNNWNNHDTYYGLDLHLIDSSTFFGEGSPAFVYNPESILIKRHPNNTLTWYNTSQILNITQNTTSVKDVIPLDSGYLLFLYERIPDTSFTSYTKVISLIWVTENIQFPELIYKDTITHHVQGVNMYSLDMGSSNSIFINYDYSTTVSHGYNLKLTIPKSITSVQQIKPEKRNLQIYPNPTNNSFTINNKSEGTLRIYDLSGKLIRTKTLHQNQSQVAISSFQNGMYILYFTDIDGITEVGKLLISKTER